MMEVTLHSERDRAVELELELELRIWVFFGHRRRARRLVLSLVEAPSSVKCGPCFHV